MKFLPTLPIDHLFVDRELPSILHHSGKLCYIQVLHNLPAEASLAYSAEFLGGTWGELGGLRVAEMQRVGLNGRTLEQGPILWIMFQSTCAEPTSTRPRLCLLAWWTCWLHADGSLRTCPTTKVLGPQAGVHWDFFLSDFRPSTDAEFKFVLTTYPTENLPLTTHIPSETLQWLHLICTSGGYQAALSLLLTSPLHPPNLNVGRC